MKQIVYLLLILTNIVTINAQQVDWEKTLGGMHADYLYDAIPTLDYGFIMVGGTLSNNNGDVNKNGGDYDFFVTKLSEYGKVEWTKPLGGTGTDMVKSITNTYDGGYLLAGVSNSPSKDQKTTKHLGGQDIWLIKLDIKGNIAWQKTLGGIANDDVMDVVRTQDGGFVLAATSASDIYTLNSKEAKAPEAQDLILKKEQSRGDTDYWIVKMDIQGKEQWQRTLGAQYQDELRNVVVLSDGSIVLGGVSNSLMEQDKKTAERGMTDWWVVKLDKKGQTIWQESYGEEGNDQLYSMVITPEEEILLGGTFQNMDEQGKLDADFVLIKIDQVGQIITENTYSEGSNDILTDVVVNLDGTHLISGYSKSTIKATDKKSAPTKNTEDYIVIKLDQSGEELWRKIIGSDKKEVLRKSIQTRDGGYVLMGSSIPLKNRGNNDVNFWIVKLLDKDKPKTPKLPIESVPNPTIDYTTIIIGEEYERGVISVFDFNGVQIQNFNVDGRRMIPISLGRYPDGVYIISLKAEGQQFSTKVIKVNR
jgi:hypothetical protein